MVAGVEYRNCTSLTVREKYVRDGNDVFAPSGLVSSSAICGQTTGFLWLGVESMDITLWSSSHSRVSALLQASSRSVKWVRRQPKKPD